MTKETKRNITSKVLLLFPLVIIIGFILLKMDLKGNKLKTDDAFKSEIPVELFYSHHVVYDDNTKMFVHLTWTHNSLTPFIKYTLEKSEQGGNYIPIATQSAGKNDKLEDVMNNKDRSTPNIYNKVLYSTESSGGFIYNELFAEKGFSTVNVKYRLKAERSDGSIVYSEVVGTPVSKIHQNSNSRTPCPTVTSVPKGFTLVPGSEVTGISCGCGKGTYTIAEYTESCSSAVVCNCPGCNGDCHPNCGCTVDPCCEHSCSQFASCNCVKVWTPCANLASLFVVTAVNIDTTIVNDTCIAPPVIVDLFSNFTYACTPPFMVTLSAIVSGIEYNIGDSLTFEWFTGDGNVIYSSARLNSAKICTTGIYYTYANSGAYSLQLIVKGPDGLSDTAINYSYIIVDDSCGTISGIFYFDEDSDCVLDTSEQVLRHAKVELFKNGNSFMFDYTNAYGIYSFEVPIGIDTYAVKLSSFDFMGVGIDSNCVCPSSMQYDNITQQSAGLNFGYQCAINIDASFSYLTPRGTVTPGTVSKYYLMICNNSFISISSGTYYIIHNPLLTFDSASVTPAYYNNDTIAWNFSNLAPNQCFNLFVWLNTPPIPTVNLGDTFCIYGFVDVAGDVNPVNNYRDNCYFIGGSYDPNNMLVNPPIGFGEMAKVKPSQQTFHYQINFQNTGTDVAYNIVLMDTLDALLDINTLQLGSASHNYDLNVIGNNILKFNFNNIMLPDSGADRDGSHGFAEYTIGPKTTLQHGNIIKARAGIYFDFNPVVLTNDAVVIVDSTSTGIKNMFVNYTQPSVLIYPNPFTNATTISISDVRFTKGDLVIYDVLGKVVHRQSLIAKQEKLNLKLAKGLYFYKIMNLPTGQAGGKENIAVGKIVVAKE